MRKILAGVMVVNLVACLVAAIVFFGGVTLESAMPAFGLAALMSVCWAAKLCLSDRVSWKQSPLHLPVLALMIYGTVRYFLSDLEYESRLELFHIVLYGFVYFVASFNCYRSRDRKILLRTLLGLAVLQSGYGIYQAATESPNVLHLLRPEQYHGRAGGSYVCPNHLAGFLELLLGVLLARIIIIRSAKKVTLQKFAIRKVILIYLCLIVLAGLVATFSRAAWIATLLGFMVFLVLKGWHTKTIWPRVAMGVAGVLFIAVIVWKLDSLRSFVQVNVAENVAQSAEESEVKRITNAGTRLAMWGGACKVIGDSMQNVLIGTGPGTWTWYHLEHRNPALQIRPVYVHNDYLHLVSDYGLVGLGIMAWLLVSFFRHAALFLPNKNSSDQRSFAAGVIIALVIMLVHSLFDFNMHVPANALFVAVLMGFTVGMDDSGKVYRRIELLSWRRYALALVVLLFPVFFVLFYWPSFMSERYVALGDAAEDQLLRDKAVEYYIKAQEHDPANPNAYSHLGYVYDNHARVPTVTPSERSEMLKFAISQFDQSLALNHLQSDVMVRMASAFGDNGETENAITMFDAAKEVDPNYASLYLRLAHFYRKHKEEEKAFAAFRRSRELNSWADNNAFVNLEQMKPGSGHDPGKPPEEWDEIIVVPGNEK